MNISDFKYKTSLHDIHDVIFNPLQVLVVDHIDSDCNLCVAAPTASGKTLIIEMVISHTLEHGKKAIYLAPMKSLVEEKHKDFSKLYKGHCLCIMTGDYSLSEEKKKLLKKAEIIVMTPEMLSSRVRNFRSERNQWLNDVGAMIDDESHLLASDDRGDHLEAAMMQFTFVNPNARLIFLSATMKNASEIEEWMTVLNNKHTELIESDYRPCKLKMEFIPLHIPQGPEAWNKFEEEITINIKSRVDLPLSSHLFYIETAKVTFNILEKYPYDKFLIFVMSKAYGRWLQKIMKLAGLRALFHNADENRTSRCEIEEDFKEGDLQYLISTQTLAWGVNLPAKHSIVSQVEIVKEAPAYDIIQECGRAGRPKYDKIGYAHVIIPVYNFQYHVNRIEEGQVIKSVLDKRIAFHLTAAIYNNQVNNISSLHNWYQRSLMYHQKKIIKDGFIEDLLQQLIRKDIITDDTGFFRTTRAGRIAAQMYYNPFDIYDLKNNFNDIIKYHPVFSMYNTSDFRKTINTMLDNHHKYDDDSKVNDSTLALSFASIDSNNDEDGYISRAETNAVMELEVQGFSYDKNNNINGNILKIAGAYFTILQNIKCPDGLKSTYIPINNNQEKDRTMAILQRIESEINKTGYLKFYDRLKLRLKYGAPWEFTDLLRIKGIGMAYADNLFEHKIHTVNDIVKPSNKDVMVNILGKKVTETTINHAKKLMKLKIESVRNHETVLENADDSKKQKKVMEETTSMIDKSTSQDHQKKIDEWI